MTQHNPSIEAAGAYPDSTPPPDGSGKAPGAEPQTIEEWKAKAEAAVAGEAKAKSDLSSMDGRYQKLRRDVENEALGGNADSFAPVLAEGMVLLAQAADPEGTTGVASRIQDLVNKGATASSEASLARKEQFYIDQINGLVNQYGLDSNAPEVAAAAKLFNASTSDIEMERALGMIKDVALAKGAWTGPITTPESLMPKPDEPNPAADGPQVPFNMNPSAVASPGATATGQALLDKDLSKMTQDELQQQKRDLLSARKRGDFYPANTF